MTINRNLMSSGATKRGFGIIAGSDSGYLASTEKYMLGDDTVLSATSMTLAKGGGGSSSSQLVGLSAGGIVSAATLTNATQIYTFLGDTSVAGTALSAVTGYGGGFGNSTNGYAVQGYITNLSTLNATNTWVYNYSGNSVSAGTALAARSYVSTFSSKTIGYSAGGYNAGVVGTTNKYTYSGNSVSAGTAITGVSGGAGNSNYTYGIILSGSSPAGATHGLTITQKYTYSGDSVAGSSALPSSLTYGTPVGDLISCILSSGSNISGTVVATTLKFNYSSESTSTGTSLTTARESASGFSNMHGGL